MGCAAGLSLTVSAAGPPAPTPLADLPPDTVTQAWGSLQLDKAVAGTPLSIGGRAFARGLGTHANGEITYDLDAGATSFSAWIGVDDHLKNHPEAPKASVVFQVIGDGRTLFESGIMRSGDAAKPVTVALNGVLEMKLVVTDAGDGNSCDHADWAEATLTGPPTAAPAAPAYTISTDGISVQLASNGSMVSARIGASEWPLTGSTRLPGFRPQGVTVMTAEPSTNARAFANTLTDGKGHTCTVTDRFTPDRGSIRWDIEITSTDAFWTAPVVSRLQCANPEEQLIWTAWGSPDYSGSKLTPELTARVQADKTSVSSAWSDPLVPVGFPNRAWHYGNVAQGCPVGDDYVALPLVTMMAPATNTGLSLVLSPEDVLLNLDLTVSAAGQVRYARTNHRLGGGRTVTFTSHLVPHEASWRGGLRFMTSRYPQWFQAPNPRAHQLAGCGAYTLCEAPIDVAKFKRMAFGFNWKLSDDFPYMGMFIPPVKTMDETWTRSCGEPAPAGQGPETSCRQMNQYAKYMKDHGFAVLSYFNVTEFGKNMYDRKPVKQADDPELWKDPVAYLRFKLPTAVFDPGIQTCYSAFIVDPGDPAYLNHLLEQAARNTAMLPDTAGICIDRADWLRLYNPQADDGVSWVNGKPARSLFRSWGDLMSKMGPQLHRADKIIFSNMMTMRLELCRELDGIYTEFGNNGNALNASAMLGLHKPVVAWSYNETIRQPDPDGFMQRHLHLGAFPTAPYPNNNHCINPEPAADQLYLDYGPLLAAMRGRQWVLAPRCVETMTPGVKTNLFEVPGGYALPVTFGGTTGSATIRLRNLPGLDHLKATVLHPGTEAAIPCAASSVDDSLEVIVPLKRGCAMVQLTRQE